MSKANYATVQIHSISEDIMGVCTYRILLLYTFVLILCNSVSLQHVTCVMKVALLTVSETEHSIKNLWKAHHKYLL